MKILLLGSGGREHAVARQLHAYGHELLSLSGNAGIEALAHLFPSEEDPLLCAQREEVDLTFVGPELPLADGIVDRFQAAGLKIFGPTREAAQLESSKAFAKRFMERYGIPTAHSAICSSAEEAYQAAARFGGKVVVKPSGLTSGKGVTVCHTLREAKEAIDALMVSAVYGAAGSEVIVEECLVGQEYSLMLFCDGRRMVPMPVACDYKRLCEGGKGPNTGGMGAIAPVMPGCWERIEAEVIERTSLGLEAEGIDYRGVLYCGLMATEDGPKVLEYNCRFGDPEAQVVLPLMLSDLAETMVACAEGNVTRALPRWSDQSACAVIMASGGYPGRSELGKEIQGLSLLAGLDSIYAYHAGTRREGRRVVTAGGRVLAIAGTAASMERAIERAYKGVEAIEFEGSIYRSDIGQLPALATPQVR